MADVAWRCGPTSLAATATTIQTALPTNVNLLHIRVVNTDSVAHVFYLSIGVDAGGTRLYSAEPVPAHRSFSWAGFETLKSGEIVQAFADTANVLTMTLSGVAT